jgi:hypothetical protein
MTRGEYSPSLWSQQRPPDYDRSKDYIYNCYGEIPPERPSDSSLYDEKLHMSGYDYAGFGEYGYSGFNSEKNYIGFSNGVDRWGYTELDYMSMTEDDYEDLINSH